jgi:hypothetical protein
MIAPLRNHYRSFELRGDLADRVVPAQNRRNLLKKRPEPPDAHRGKEVALQIVDGLA